MANYNEVFEELIDLFDLTKDVNIKRNRIASLYCKFQHKLAEIENKMFLMNFLLSKTRESLRAECFLQKEEKRLSDKMIDNMVETQEQVISLLEKRKETQIEKNRLEAVISCFNYGKNFLLSGETNVDEIEKTVINVLKKLKGAKK